MGRIATPGSNARLLRRTRDLSLGAVEAYTVNPLCDNIYGLLAITSTTNRTNLRAKVNNSNSGRLKK